MKVLSKVKDARVFGSYQDACEIVPHHLATSSAVCHMNDSERGIMYCNIFPWQCEVRNTPAYPAYHCKMLK